MKHFNITVIGHVQGIGYRWQAQKKATFLGLKGFIENRPDATVYIEVEGKPEKLKDFIEWCKSGPSNAVVHDLQIDECELKEYTHFHIRH
ncbi:MAG: acylphosphatase [Bacteroidetes bacterium]|nr:acylphosphatase [Bacteroidota bacterium]MBL6963254.1 acylphosphatase [Bacteroidota bacterium]